MNWVLLHRPYFSKDKANNVTWCLLINGGFDYITLMFQACLNFIYKFLSFDRDEGVHWGIQNGLYLSRSTVVYFKHNDMDSLRETLENIYSKNKRIKKLRRYIVVEAVYQVYLVYHACVRLDLHFYLVFPKECSQPLVLKASSCMNCLPLATCNISKFCYMIMNY